VTQIVPVQVDLPKPGPIAGDPRARFDALRVVAVRDEEQRPRRFEAALEVARLSSEHERRRPQLRAPLENRRKASLRIEWDPPILPVLRVRAGNRDLMLIPVRVTVLDAEHLALTTARLSRSPTRLARWTRFRTEAV
jgi:hypothetical protein